MLSSYPCMCVYLSYEMVARVIIWEIVHGRNEKSFFTHLTPSQKQNQIEESRQRFALTGSFGRGKLEKGWQDALCNARSTPNISQKSNFRLRKQISNVDENSDRIFFHLLIFASKDCFHTTLVCVCYFQLSWAPNYKCTHLNTKEFFTGQTKVCISSSIGQSRPWASLSRRS